MASVVIARLNDARLVEAVDTQNVAKKQKVILNIEGVLEFATVERVEQKDTDSAILIERIASPEDIEANAQNLACQIEDKTKVLDLVQKHNLSLKLVAVLRSFDNKKLLVMYTADERVDFRLLVREMAGVFKMRIEMRQIGDREEACFVGGCGACGQPICCRRFLTQPKQSTIKMAKVQGQALNPNKVNGLCGKIMCCLSYEYTQYQEILASMPKIGASVDTPKGNGVVEYNDCLRELVAVRFEDESVEKFPLADIVVQKKESEDSDE